MHPIKAPAITDAFQIKRGAKMHQLFQYMIPSSFSERKIEKTKRDEKMMNLDGLQSTNNRFPSMTQLELPVKLF
jgi:hypothetical protein